MLLTISGALRRASTNRSLLAEAARLYGGPVEDADIRLPLYDGDMEAAEGIPEAATRLFDRIDAAEAVVIASPEYNYGMTAALKNALDWVSRVKGNPWYDKPVAIMGAAAGRTGAARSTAATHIVMSHFKPRFTKGPEVLIAQSHTAFDTDGRLVEPRAQALLVRAMDALRAEAQGV